MDQDWQTAKTNHQKNKKRVYVGNLIYANDLQTQESLIRNLFASSAIPTKQIEIIPLKKPLGKCYALVECDVNNAIKCLNGILFQGERIVVKAEQKQFSNSQGKSSRHKNAMSSFGGGGWSQPTMNAQKRQHKDDTFKTKKIVSGFQQLDIQESSIHPNDDPQDNFYHRKKQSLETLMGEYGEYDPNYEKMKQQPQTQVDSSPVASNLETMKKINNNNNISNNINNNNNIINNNNISNNINDFFSKCKTPLSELLQDYGEYDPDYEKMKQQPLIPSTHDDSLSKLQQQKEEQKEEQEQSTKHEGMLTTHGPIHVQIVSFGYKYGTPKQGYWSHSNPMSALDCRYLPRCHFSLAKFSGLHYKVKKSMTRRHYYGHDPSDDMEEHSKDNNNDDNNKRPNEVEEKDATMGQQGTKDNELVTKAKEVAHDIQSCVIDAIQDGGHGYAFPLEMTIYVGSEYGRHRSVVLVETIAVQLRQLLRRNEGGKITQPVSVSTRHRDVDLNHKDEEAFGKDLEREHKMEVKRKKKQEWLEASNVYDSHW